MNQNQRLADYHTSRVCRARLQWELLVWPRDEEPEAFVVVVRMRIGGASSLATLLVVVVTSVTGSSDLSLSIAYRSAGNVALPGLDSFFDGSLSDD